MVFLVLLHILIIVRMSVNRKLLITSFIIIFVTSIIIGIFGYKVSFDTVITNFIKTNQQISHILALSLSYNEHPTFTDSTSNSNKSYNNNLALLSETLKQNPTITYIYSLIPDGDRGFAYAIDGIISKYDTIWIETNEIGLKCYYEDDKLIIHYNNVKYITDFTIKKTNNIFKVSIKKIDGKDYLLLDNVTLGYFEKSNNLQFVTEKIVIDKNNRNQKILFSFSTVRKAIYISLTLAGESESTPGSEYINSPEIIRFLNNVLITGIDSIKDYNTEDIYGNTYFFVSVIKDTFGNANGLLVVESSNYEFDAKRFQIIFSLTVTFLIMSIIIMGILNITLRFTVSKPLKAIMNGVSKVRLGEDDWLVDVRTHDEFESFADAFNAMAASIQQNREMLEGTVKERNNELAIAYEELKEKNVKLENLARKDVMTGLSNKYEIIESLAIEKNRLQRYLKEPRKTSSLVFIDLDNFKYFNDSFGHAVGDLILIEFAKLLKTSTRICDVVGRYGGDEFIMILPETAPKNAFILMSRILESLHNHDSFKVQIETILKTSISIPKEKQLGFSCGISSMADCVSYEEAMKVADDLLYSSKKNGKNQITIQTFE